LPTPTAKDATKREHCGGILSECLSFDPGSRRVGLDKTWLTAQARTCSFEKGWAICARNLAASNPSPHRFLSAEVVRTNGGTCGSKNRRSTFAVHVLSCEIFCCKIFAPKIFAPCVGSRADRHPTLCQRADFPNTYLVPTANTRRDFLFAVAACRARRLAVRVRARALSITGPDQDQRFFARGALSRARRSGPRTGTRSGGKALGEVRAAAKPCGLPGFAARKPKPAAYSSRLHNENRNCHKSGVP
jgi:hypothetical protein